MIQRIDGETEGAAAERLNMMCESIARYGDADLRLLTVIHTKIINPSPKSISVLENTDA